MMLRAVRSLAILLLATGVAACSGGNASVPHGPAAPGGAGRLAHARFVITIPKRKHRKAHFVSPATQSMTVDLKLGGNHVTGFPQTVNLTPTSNGCTSSLASTQCVLSVSLAPANGYTATIATYDATNAGGSELSHAQNVGFNVLVGKSNAIALTLNGIPASLSIAGGAPAVHGSAGAGFTIYGLDAAPLIVNAVDADGNAIVGAGSPTYSAAVVSGTWSAPPAPVAKSPNLLQVTPPGTNGSGAVLKITAAYSDGTCALSGAVCTATVSLKNDVQSLYVANYSYGGGTGGVAEYTPPFSDTSSPAHTENTNAYAYAFAMTPTQLLIGNGTGVNEVGIDSLSLSPVGAFGGTILGVPHSLALDASGNLYVANRGGNGANPNTLMEFAGPQTGASSPVATVATGTAPYQVVLDPSGNVWVANEGGNTLQMFAPPLTNASTPSITINDVSLNEPYALAFDPAGDLFVANWGGNTVTEYSAPLGNASTPSTTMTTGTWPAALALDGAGNVFVATQSDVEMFKPPYTGSPLTITNGIATPYAMALDGANNLFVANQTGGAGWVTEYAPPYTAAPVATIVNGMKDPAALIFTP